MSHSNKSLTLTHGVLWAAAILGAALAGAEPWFAIGGLSVLAVIAIGTLSSDRAGETESNGCIR